MKHPDKMGPPNECWMVLTEEGPEYFDNEDDAREEAERTIHDYCGDDGWDEAVEQVVVARVIACAGKIEVEPVSEDTAEIEDFDELDNGWRDTENGSCNYVLLDVLTDDLIGQNSKYQ